MLNALSAQGIMVFFPALHTSSSSLETDSSVESSGSDKGAGTALNPDALVSKTSIWVIGSEILILCK
jgi:hypothetical protein